MKRKLKLPRRLESGRRAWTSDHYDRAADAVIDAIGADVEEWAEIREAIRDVLESPVRYVLTEEGLKQMEQLAREHATGK